MSDYKTPNVYIEEIASLPPSVVGMATSIPAFIGYTEKLPKGANDEEASYKPIRINNLLEYESIFGKAKAETSLNPPLLPTYMLYYQMQMYFANGGGICYIVSAGKYATADAKNKDHFKYALNALATEDEPTLLVLSDAITLPSGEYYTICQQALQQCYELGNRFAILDVAPSTAATTPTLGPNIDTFRDAIHTNLKHGAAYFPYLETSLPYFYNADTTLTDTEFRLGYSSKLDDDQALTVKYPSLQSPSTINLPQITVTLSKNEKLPEFTLDTNKTSLTIVINENTKADTIAAAWQIYKQANPTVLFDIEANKGDGIIKAATLKNLVERKVSLNTLRSENIVDYYKTVEHLNKLRVTLPPAAAIAGVYARVDNERGVWKAPANVSLNSVIQPTLKITNIEQENLNVTPGKGQSINAIRSFTGAGTVVWGSRTLAGNDNEWRYIPVRRLFNMVEASLKRATAFAVFEPNYEMTWLKVRVMIDNYLNELWKKGAFAGSKAEDAYFVRLGLGKTMTAQDILEGRMIVEIGIAAVRPAEFIILRLSHMLQRA